VIPIKADYIFTDSQIEQIREGALSILDEIGVGVGKPELVEELARMGFRTDGKYVKIDRAAARAKMEAQKADRPERPKTRRVMVTWTSPYSHTYETIDGAFEPITTESNLKMGEFAANAARLWPGLILSCPGHPTDVPPEAQFLRHTVNSFLRADNFSPMEPVSLKTADYHFAVCEAMGRPVKELPVYVASPLNIAGESFEIALRYHRRMERIAFNSMPSLGANTPLNLIAAYSQTIAETLGGALIFEALTGTGTCYGASIFAFDFRDMAMPFGTPEKLLLEWLNMEVQARVPGGEYYGPDYTDIHTNAVRCGIQACAEKASLATAGAVKGAHIFACSGTLGMDELFSPVQLLLDLEMLEHIGKITDGMPVDEFESDLIAEVRAGLKSGYIMADRTLDNMDKYVWQSRFFNRKTFGSYLYKPFPAEIDRAREMAYVLIRKPAVWRLNDSKADEIEAIYAAALKQLREIG